MNRDEFCAQLSNPQVSRVGQQLSLLPNGEISRLYHVNYWFHVIYAITILGLFFVYKLFVKLRQFICVKYTVSSWIDVSRKSSNLEQPTGDKNTYEKSNNSSGKKSLNQPLISEVDDNNNSNRCKNVNLNSNPTMIQLPRDTALEVLYELCQLLLKNNINLHLELENIKTRLEKIEKSNNKNLPMNHVRRQSSLL